MSTKRLQNKQKNYALSLWKQICSSHSACGEDISDLICEYRRLTITQKQPGLGTGDVRSRASSTVSRSLALWQQAGPRQVQMNKPEPAYLETDVITLGSHETEGREDCIQPLETYLRQATEGRLSQSVIERGGANVTHQLLSFPCAQLIET
ncbi:hypothetical protein RRG08_016340 [Elysia crispata]|uniref:Uncharacterized protein n=1 Tax=Elysia crispata TaxID=231223 RepID=A0AAE0YF70_9GAST|nr:hypothetical protein RRG08_016340 [Elysia crispata]